MARDATITLNERKDPFVRFELVVYPDADGTGVPTTSAVEGPMSKVIDAVDAGLAALRGVRDEHAEHRRRGEDS